MELIRVAQAGEVRGDLNELGQMLVPVIKGFVHSFKQERHTLLAMARGGEITLEDLAYEQARGSGDAAICFELAVHEWIEDRNPTMLDLMASALTVCNIFGDPQSLLFAPEKVERVSVLESAEGLLTGESRLYTGRQGRPITLQNHLESAYDAFSRRGESDALPLSIRGLWKADLFVGTREHDAWVAATVKLHRSDFEAAPGLRLGIYAAPDGEYVAPQLDQNLGLILVGMPYDPWFLELFYRAFRIFREFVATRGKMPDREALPNRVDREMASLLVASKHLPVSDVIAAIGRSERLVLHPSEVITVGANAPVQCSLFDTPSPAVTVVGVVPGIAG
jgi:hypothetical protein